MDVTTRRIVPTVRSLFSEPEAVESRSVVTSAVLLAVLLVGVVPLVVLSTGVPLLVMVGLAGIVYAVILVLSDRVFEGLCAAVFVLCTFGANVPLLSVPFDGGAFHTGLNVVFVDIGMIPLAALFILRGDWNVSLFGIRAETVAGYALAGFAVWAALAGVFGHGPFRTAALFFAVDQFRYLLLFVVVATIMRYIGIRSAIYSLMVGIFGNVVFMFVETLNHGSFGFTYLGEVSRPALGTFSIGPVVIQTSMYSGFTGGTSRVLVPMLLLVLPVAVMELVRGSYWRKALAVVCLLAGILLTRLSNSDAALAALLLTVALILVSLVYVTVTTRKATGDEKLEYALGYLGTIATGVLTYLLFSQRTVKHVVTGTAESEAGGGSAASGGSTAGGAASTDPTLTETILSVANAVPFIDTSSLPVRIQQYVDAITIALNYPLFGLGGGNFRVIAASYGLPQGQSIHNTILGYLVAVGVPGVVFYLVAIIAVLFVAIKRSRTGDPTDRLFWLMLVCGMLGFHAMTFWITAYRTWTTFMVFWVFAGVVVGSSYWSKKRTRYRTS